MTWWMWALAGALIWGVHYNLIAKSLTAASPLTIYFLPNIILMATLPLWYKVLISDFHSISEAPLSVKISTIIIMFTSILGSVAVYKAIHSSNATLASLIEISYPVFVSLFAFLIFRDNQVNIGTIIGGLLIMVGTSVVIYTNG